MAIIIRWGLGTTWKLDSGALDKLVSFGLEDDTVKGTRASLGGCPAVFGTTAETIPSSSHAGDAIVDLGIRQMRNPFIRSLVLGVIG